MNRAKALAILLREMASHKELDARQTPVWMYADIAAEAADELERLNELEHDVLLEQGSDEDLQRFELGHQ